MVGDSCEGLKVCWWRRFWNILWLTLDTLLWYFKALDSESVASTRNRLQRRNRRRAGGIWWTAAGDNDWGIRWLRVQVTKTPNLDSITSSSDCNCNSHQLLTRSRLLTHKLHEIYDGVATTLCRECWWKPKELNRRDSLKRGRGEIDQGAKRISWITYQSMERRFNARECGSCEVVKWAWGPGGLLHWDVSAVTRLALCPLLQFADLPGWSSKLHK